MVGYIGRQAVNGNFVKLDSITTSATTTFNLLNGGVAYSPESARNCIVSLNGVIQSPETAYNIVGSTIVFSQALTSNDVINHIIVLGDVNTLGTVSDGTITASKLGTDAVIEAKIQDNAVTTNKINNDAITIDKINLITSASAPSLEAKGSGSNSGKIILNCENNSHGVSIQAPAHANFSGNYTLTLPTSDGNNEEFLQTNGSGVLTWATAGGGNTPHFEAHLTSNQDVSDEAITKVTLDTEIVDSDNKFTSSRFTPTVAGKYYIEGQVRAGGSSGQGSVAQINVYLYKNGSLYKDGYFHNENSQSHALGEQTLGVSGIIDMDADDYIELYARSDINTGTPRFIAGTKSTYLLGYKIG